MKTKLVQIITIFGIIFGVFGFTHEAKADTCESEDGGYISGCCEVSTKSSTASTESLGNAIIAYNDDNQWNLRECYNEIVFSTSEVVVKQALEITHDNDGDELVIGNESEVVDWTSQVSGDEPLLKVASGIETLTLQNIRIDGTNGTAYIHCEGSNTQLNLINVDFKNVARALYVKNCNVEISGTDVSNSTDSSANVIQIGPDVSVGGSGPGSVKINDLDMDNIEGTGLAINYSSDVEVDYEITSSKNATAADFYDVRFTGLNVTATEVHNGIIMNEVNGQNIDVLAISLQGAKKEGGSDTTGIGLTLDVSATHLNFQNIQVSNFGSHGIAIYDGSNYNTFGNGATIYNNGGYGILIGGEAQNNTIKGVPGDANNQTVIYNNGDCGIKFETPNQNKVSGVDVFSNGGCAIGASGDADYLNLDEDIVTLIALSDNQLLFDIDYETVDDNLAYMGGASTSSIELHYLSSLSSSSSSSSDSSSDDSGSTTFSARTTYKTSLRKGSKSVVSGGLNFGSRSGQGSGSTPVFYSTYASTGSSGGNAGGSSSYITTISKNNTELPKDDITVQNTEQPFFAVVLDGEGDVIGIWNGEASTSGNDTDDRCYKDPTSNTKYRIYDEYLDSDGDGLMDWEEDANRNCVRDSDETDVDNADTDGDGLTDYQERKEGNQATGGLTTDTDGDGLLDALDWDSDNDDIADGLEDKNGDGNLDDDETDPLKADTDGDGLEDGEEDINQNGEVDSNETNPRKKDTDGDGKNDGDDSCPLMTPQEGTCYYDHCTPGEVPAYESDDDGDGILSHLEDTNLNCQRDSGETDASNSDTDGDGIPDGIEDYNKNGIYEPSSGETDPLSTDSDNDCITDGNEDKNGDGLVDLGNGETDPASTDSDDDGILDGDEDLNCNGSQDSGETSASLADTDGDGTNDDTDICPWSIKSNCVVRYCGVSGFSDYDADGDGLPDSQEDANGDCAHTPSAKEPHPLMTDTDEDGLTDDLEDCYQTNPNVADTDGDGRSDADEVSNSGELCQPMYNLGDSDPLRAEFGNCSLGTQKGATSSAAWPIILMSLLMLPVVRLKTTRRKA